MILLHNQTSPIAGPALKTAWVFNSSGLSNFVTSSGIVTPKVGTYMLNQTESSTTNYGRYKNNISSTWDQYTIEGWVNCTVSSTSGLRANYLVIGSVNTGNYVEMVITPNYPTNQYFISVSGQYNNGANSFGITSIPAIGNNAWTYYAFVKASNNLRYVLINGVIAATLTTSFVETIDTTTDYALTFGDYFGSEAMSMVTTNWDMTRISNIARYNSTQTFTPPTTMFTNDPNTWYLSNFENTWTPAPSPT